MRHNDRPGGPMRLLSSLAIALIAFTAIQSNGLEAHQTNQPTLYIAPTQDGFENYLAAAMMKKGVPVSVVDHEDGATYVLKAGKIQTKQVGGATKAINCLFAYCNGNEDKGSTAVQLVQAGTIKWSYSVN